jgi:HEPN domain-containing protein
MTPNEWLLDETRRLVQRAQSDLRAAEMCATELPATALFHCQQAAEKFLKACLTWNQKALRKTHELDELAAACALIDPTLESALDPATALSKYAWQFRYPGAPYEPDAQEAAVGRALAEQVRVEISNRLPQGAFRESESS